MCWSVQRQKRPSGDYYTALFTPASGPRRCVTVGLVAGSPAPATLTARLRAHDGGGAWGDETVVRACGARTDEDVRRLAARVVIVPAPLQGRARPTEPLTPEGRMTLNNYVADVWEPVRSAQAGTWKREQWWWVERILPALGAVRICELDARKWSAFLDTLTVAGRSKALAQTAYRTALRHACAVLGWIEGPHPFAPIRGATLRTRAEAEPLTIVEVTVFLDAVHLPVHRALFAVQIGQGLRPAEATAVRWEDIDFNRSTIFVRGEKNALARATVPLTPFSKAELLAWWEQRGRPKTGVCFEKQGGGPFPAYPRQAFRTAAINSGLNTSRERALFPYVCRHTFATIAAVAGVDRAFTKRMMRHSQKSTVLDEAYIRVSVRDTANAFAGFVAVKRVEAAAEGG